MDKFSILSDYIKETDEYNIRNIMEHQFVGDYLFLRKEEKIEYL